MSCQHSLNGLCGGGEFLFRDGTDQVLQSAAQLITLCQEKRRQKLSLSMQMSPKPALQMVRGKTEALSFTSALGFVLEQVIWEPMAEREFPVLLSTELYLSAPICLTSIDSSFRCQCILLQNSLLVQDLDTAYFGDLILITRCIRFLLP